MMKTIVVALLLIGLMAGTSLAATVTYELIGSNVGAGTFEVYATVVGGGGLAFYGFDLVGATGITNMGPWSQFSGGAGGELGFGTARSGNGTIPVNPVSGAQDTTTPASLVYNVGISGGSLTGPHYGTLVQEVYGAPVLLATGSYTDSGAVGFGLDTGANVFVTNSGVDADPATSLNTVKTIIPEPATMLVLLGGALMAVIRRRR
jgi:hypothetical protein